MSARTATRVLAHAEGNRMAEEVRAEMVANVWKVLVAEGDTVADGDTLVILESMKMEIPVLAEVDGTISKVAVQEGGLVQEGDLIAEIS
jgi:acetyl-CoA carboxylase biotin carboxyl carrier protein